MNNEENSNQRKNKYQQNCFKVSFYSNIWNKQKLK